MASTDYKLRFQIDADAKRAKAELRDVDGLIKKLGAKSSLKDVVGSANSDFGSLSAAASKAAGSIPIPFAAAAGAIAGVAAAAVGAGSALFALVKNASDFGSVIFDATQKTGLSAEVISTLKFAADNAGSSLENVTGGVAKFAKVIGEAANGSEKAKKTLKDLGVTSTDINTALGQAIKTINEYPEGVQQMALSQRAFGKTGADLIPVIKQLNGDLDGSVKTATRFGLTLNDEAIQAADDFGDTLGLLGSQATVTAAKFGLVVAPVITDAMKEISEAFAQNEDTVRAWAVGTRDFIAGFIGGVEAMPKPIYAAADAASFLTGGLITLGNAWNYATFGAHHYLMEQAQFINSIVGAKGAAGLGTTSGAAGHGSKLAAGVGLNFDFGTGGGKGGGGGKHGKAGKSAEQLERERLQGIKRDTADELALRSATDESILASIKQRLTEGNVSEVQAIEQTNRTVMAQLLFKRQVLKDELQAVRGNVDEETRITREQALHEQLILKTRIEQQTAVFEAAKKGRGAAYDLLIKEIDKQQELRIELTKNLAVENERFDLMTKELNLQVARPPHGYKFNKKTGQIEEYDKPGTSKYDPDLGGKVSKSLGEQFGIVGTRDENGKIKSQAQFMKDVYADAAQGIAQSIGLITQSLSDMLVQMIVTGEMSGKAALQMAAGVALGLAMQAGIKAIFEVAEGIAAAANPFTAALAPAHFLAAKTYAIVAAVAGGAGVGLALGARSMGGGSKQSSRSSYGSSSSASSPKRSEDLTPYSRQTKDAFISGRHDETAAFVVRALDRFDQTLKKFEPMRPGDVLVAGTREKPGHIGNQVVKDISGNSGIGRSILQKSGVR
jgi:hypothetical protein